MGAIRNGVRSRGPRTHRASTSVATSQRTGLALAAATCPCNRVIRARSSAYDNEKAAEEAAAKAGAKAHPIALGAIHHTRIRSAVQGS